MASTSLATVARVRPLSAMMRLTVLIIAFGVVNATPVDTVRGLLRRISPQFDLSASIALSIEPLPANLADAGDTGFFRIAKPGINDTSGSVVHISGSNGVDLASGVHWYLKYYLNASISWWGDQLDVLPRAPAQLPPLPAGFAAETRSTSHANRYYMNTCTFGYSTAFWSWERWEREIDWMALNGINLPLAFVGQEKIVYEVMRDLGLSEAQLSNFFSGPAVLPWMRMGNLQRWLGPLPMAWMDSHHALQLKILARMRALGMRPVLPAFSGLVPDSMRDVYPKASYVKSSGWALGIVTTFLQATDPLFSRIGRAFIEKQQALYNGTDHMYNCDLYNELKPPSNAPEYLANVSSGVHAAMRAADPEAVWVMQGWLFHNEPDFWQPAQMKAMLGAVEHGRLLILDLYAEDSPVWNRTDSFYGTPFVWNMLHNFGGRSGMYARLGDIATQPAAVLAANNSMTAGSGQLRGLGLTPEAIETNPIVYDLMMEMVWRKTEGVSDLDAWVSQYSVRRYGLYPGGKGSSGSRSALAAAKLLQDSVYNYTGQFQNSQGTSGSMIAARPALVVPKVSCCDVTKLYYDASEVVRAWKLLVDAGTADVALAARDTFLYDLVVTGTQALSNLALEHHAAAVDAYTNSNRSSTDRLAQFDAAAAGLLACARGADELLRTRKQFLLGGWIAAARSWATSPTPATPPSDGTCDAAPAARAPCGAANITRHDCELLMCCFNDSAAASHVSTGASGQPCFASPVSEGQLYERNARTLVTLWGPYNSGLHEYSYRLWAGLVGEFYAPRWGAWFADVRAAMTAGRAFDQDAYDAKTQVWEEAWTRRSDEFATQPDGDAMAVSQKLLDSLFTL